MKSKYLSLKKTSAALSSALLVIAAIYVLGVMHFLTKTDEINDIWLALKSQQAEKVRMEIALRSALGYGGMIHKFKNYILRKDHRTYSELEREIGRALNIISQYRTLSSKQAEHLALDDLQDAITNYQTSMEIARNAINEGKNSAEIDKLVKVDDTRAFRSLAILRNSITTDFPFYANKNHKPVITFHLRAALGYGGAIHHFKNFVLRGDLKYHEEALARFDEVSDLINLYRQQKPSPAELAALDDIEHTARQYRDNLARVKELTAKGETIELIDSIVKVDDKAALRGLHLLDQSIVLTIEQRSKELTEKITHIQNKEQNFAYGLTAAMIILASFLLWTFFKKIIRPIRTIAQSMSHLAEGDINTPLPAYDTTTELGKMAGALSLFKEREIQRREATEEIRKLAMTDPLTSLANRNQFTRRYTEMKTLAKREGRMLAILAIDLDKFKPINDTYGHATGDAVLKKVAENLLLAFRETDVVARLGGDEFGAILYGPKDVDTVILAAKRVIELLSNPILAGEHKVSIGASIGISIHYPSTEDLALEMVMKNADSALYAAKEGGRNTYRLYEKTIPNITASVTPLHGK